MLVGSNCWSPFFKQQLHRSFHEHAWFFLVEERAGPPTMDGLGTQIFLNGHVPPKMSTKTRGIRYRPKKQQQIQWTCFTYKILEPNRPLLRLERSGVKGPSFGGKIKDKWVPGLYIGNIYNTTRSYLASIF